MQNGGILLKNSDSESPYEERGKVTAMKEALSNQHSAVSENQPQNPLTTMDTHSTPFGRSGQAADTKEDKGSPQKEAFSSQHSAFSENPSQNRAMSTMGVVHLPFSE